MSEQQDMQKKAALPTEDGSKAESAVKEEKKGKMGAELWDWIKTLFIVLAVALVIRNFIFLPVRVDGSSMNTTLYDGEIMAVTRFVRYLEPLKRGDIVILIPPIVAHDGGEYYVKRIVGMPGDRIRMTQGIVFINDEPLVESYITSAFIGSFDEVVVPEGEYFVMGDNRGASHDSRSPDVGTIAARDICGRAVAVMWPFDKMRWLH